MKNKLKKFLSFLMFFRSLSSITMLFLDKELKREVFADLKRLKYECIFKNVESIRFFNYSLLNNYCFRRIFRFRLKKRKHYIAVMLLSIFHPNKKDIDLWGDIQPVFCIFHGVGDVIVCNAAGKNFSVFQNVTIGKNPKKFNRGVCVPTFGDNVSVYANAVVIGGIHIGNNCNIGAGAVVTKDIPDNSTVVGNPMRIIRK